MVDLSDDELLAELGVAVEQKAARTYTPKEKRIIAGFEDILKFYDEHGRAPQHGEQRDIFERLVGNYILQLAANPRYVRGLRCLRRCRITIMTRTILAQMPPILVKPDFLNAATLSDLLSVSVAPEAEYKPSLVTQHKPGTSMTGKVDKAFRRSTSRVLEDRFKDHFADKVRVLEGEISHAIGVRFPDPYELEMEAINNGDGAFFSTHIDTIHGMKSRHRIISSVYYYGREPKQFLGGELKIYSLDRSRSFTLEPLCNSIVFFPSIFPHEVLPVHVSTGAFEDGRFSINCWILRCS